ncbi:MAG: hypothetical protein AAF438_18645 [Pseudomonadota bacterium]
MIRRLSLILFLSSSLVVSASADVGNSVDVVKDKLGLTVENGYVDESGGPHEVSDRVFRAGLESILRNSEHLSTEDVASIKSLSHRPDGRLAYYMVKFSDDEQALRLGYRKVFVGKDRVDELLTFLLANYFYHLPLVDSEQSSLRAKTGLSMTQDPVWQDYGEYRGFLRTVRHQFNSLEDESRDCVRRMKKSFQVRKRRYQYEYSATTTELVVSESGVGIVSDDQAANVIAELANRCNG